MQSTFLRNLLLLIPTVAFVATMAGCSNEDSPASPVGGFVAKGIVIQKNGVDLVVVDSTGSISGSVTIDEGSVLDVTVLFVLADGSRGVPTSTDHSLGATVAAAGATVSTSPWRITISGLMRGSTTMTVTLQKSGAAVYTSPAIPITVKHVPANLETGDTLTYDARDRDTNDMPSGQTTKRNWHVIRTGASLFGRDSVTEILEITFDASGTNELGRDTLYYSIAADGSVYQYNLLHDLLGRIEGGEVFAGDIPAQWVKITSTQAAAGATWSAITPDSIKLSNVTLSGVPFPVDITFRMSASHNGPQQVTSPAGTYTGVRTTHTLNVKIALSGSIPLTVLNDAVTATFDYASSVGIVRQTLQGKNLVASLGGQDVAQPVLGYEITLTGVKRK